jgi:hypothetical protein
MQKKSLLTAIMKSTVVGFFVLTNVSVAVAKVYKCDGPDGPVYSDKECASDATVVELSDSTGISGVSDETKTDLAQKKSDRNEAGNRNTVDTAIDKESTELAVPNDGLSARERDNVKHRVDSKTAVTPKPKPVPTKRNR